MDTPIPVDLGRIAQDLQIRRIQVESVVQLLDEGNTVPFITRYRKERTGNLTEVTIREVQSRVQRLRELAERKETILKSIEAQGKLTDDLAAAIRAADNPKRLEDLYLPYKPKKKTKASEARDKGLEPLALRVWARDETLTDLAAAAAEFLSEEKGVATAEQALDGVGFILAEMVSEQAAVRDQARRVVWKTGKVVTTKADNLTEGQGLEYRDYFAYTEPVGHIPPHRVLAINRGDKEGPLKVKMEFARPDLEAAVLGPLELEGHPQAEFLQKAAIDALDRLLLPSLEREVRRDLTEVAERHAVEVFARNLRSLLLQPPIQKQVVLAIDPGFRTGCKVAVLDSHGQLVEHGVIHPHAPQNRRYEAKQAIKELVGKHGVNVVAIGNGTACRETEELVAEVIAEGTYFHSNPDATTMPGAEVPAAPEGEAEPQTVAESALDPAEPVVAEAIEADAPAAEPDAPATPAEEQAPPAEVPPISGGAPAPDKKPEPPINPASSSTPEVEDEEAEAQKAEVLEKPHAPETRNPSRNAEEIPPVSGGAPEPGDFGETPNDTVPPPSPEPTEPEASSAPVAEPATVSDESESVVPSASVEAIAPVEASEGSESPGEPAAEGAEAPAETAAVEGQAPAKPPKTPREPKPPKAPKPKTPPPPPSPHAADAQLAQLAYVIVNEAGASVYSASPVGREEFPDLDATTRGTVSIGRRLQDPLAELVKIEPQNIGVGLYQHDVNPKQLKESLEGVIESCVNFVGVDLNTASVPLLRHVSGLNQLTARRIVDHRKEHGPFTDREQLKAIDGVGPQTFTQAAGFLKLPEAVHPLNRTWVHPESYEAASKALEQLGFTADILNHRDQLPALHEKMNAADLPGLARDLNVGEPTLNDIFEALARPDRDPRDDLPKPIFKRGVLKLEDLQAGMELKGTVLNVVDFGAFVDIGLKDSGLVHISQLANRYIKSPHDVVSVGDVVNVWVMAVDHERKRVSLTMVKPGTERPRGPGGRRGEGRPAGERPERRPAGGQGQQGQRAPQREREGPPPPPPGARGEGASPGEGSRPAVPPPSPGGSSRGLRVPGPPQRAQQGGGGRFGGRPGAGRPGGGRPQPPKLGDKVEPTSATPPRPKKPAPAPAPLSKEALKGAEPLRTFGQLKQFWHGRDGSEGEDGAPPPPADAPSTPPAEPTTSPEANPGE